MIMPVRKITTYDLAKKIDDVGLGFWLSIHMEFKKIRVQIKCGSCYSCHYVSTMSWEDDEDLNKKYNEIIENIISLFHYTCMFDCTDVDGNEHTPYSDAIKKIESLKI